MATLPALSTLMLGIARQSPSPPLLKVCCCVGVAGIVFPVMLNWYHRIAVGPVPP
jgi:hypothetical protein